MKHVTFFFSLLLVGALAAPAAAQTRPQLDIQHFRPVGSYHNFIAVHDGVTLPKMRFGVTGGFSYGLRPLQVANQDLERTAGVIDHLFAGHVAGGFAPTDWVEIDLGIEFMQLAGTGSDILRLGGQEQVFSLGDLWVEGRFRPLREDRHPISLAVIPFVTFPTGNRNLFLTSGVPTFGAKAAVSRRWTRIHVAGHVGYRIKPGFAAIGDNLAGDDEILYALGVGVTPLVDRLDVNLEIHGKGIVGPGRATQTSDVGKGIVHAPLEMLLDARVRLPANLSLAVGAGPGLTAGAGTPAFRVFAGLTWGPPGDRDGDGLNDPKDQCPDDAEDKDGYLDADGCPELDNDGDGLPDTTDMCPMEPEDMDAWQDGDGCPELDNDGDGILDFEDRCLNEPEDIDGFEDDDGCPELDNDADGIPDAEDSCPNEMEDLDGFEDADGCPDPDNDNDGVLDVNDLCPQDPETINGVKDDDGCPDDTFAVVTKDSILILEKILFVNARDTILRRSYPVLEAVKDTLLANPQIKKIQVGGHTDSNGSNSYNQKLSEKRANAIMRYLVKAGISPEVIVSVGFGEAQPIASNETEEGRERNRRVEFTILEQETVQEKVRVTE